MRIVITGATGNVGTALVQALAVDGTHELVGVARRPPPVGPLSRFVAADVARDDLSEAFRGADVVVHLAWEIQPSRRRGRLAETNVRGTARVIQAAADAEVRRVVAASSIGVYARGPKDRLVDEAWPATGIASSTYSVHKAMIERQLDAAEERRPEMRIVRLRPALIFQRASATEQRRLFGGPFVPGVLLRAGRLPLLPDVEGLRFQAVHAVDVADAYRRAVTDPQAMGAYNVAADPVLDLPSIAQARRARAVRLPRGIAHRAFAAAYAARLHPSEPSWLDLALETPLIDSSRIRAELGWRPRYSALQAIEELLDGIADGAGGATPPLLGDSPARRLGEIAGGVGMRTPGVPPRAG
jgi:nucleoside-diphosphate-sugar epimerase